jgi:hypothetical protein
MTKEEKIDLLDALVECHNTTFKNKKKVSGLMEHWTSDHFAWKQELVKTVDEGKEYFAYPIHNYGSAFMVAYIHHWNDGTSGLNWLTGDDQCGASSFKFPNSLENEVKALIADNFKNPNFNLMLDNFILDNKENGVQHW